MATTNPIKVEAIFFHPGYEIGKSNIAGAWGFPAMLAALIRSRGTGKAGCSQPGSDRRLPNWRGLLADTERETTVQ